MKNLLIIIAILSLFSCKKEESAKIEAQRPYIFDVRLPGTWRLYYKNTDGFIKIYSDDSLHKYDGSSGFGSVSKDEYMHYYLADTGHIVIEGPVDKYDWSYTIDTALNDQNKYVPRIRFIPVSGGLVYYYLRD